MPDLVAMSNLVFTAPAALFACLKLLARTSDRSSSEPRKRFTRPLPLSRRFGRSAIGTPDFCIARTTNHRVFGDRGSRNLSGRRIFGRPDGFRGPLSVALSFLPYASYPNRCLVLA